MKIYQKIQKLNLPLAIPLLLASLLFVISSCSSAAAVVDVATPSTGVTLVTPCPDNITRVTAVAETTVTVTWTEPTAQDSNLNPVTGVQTRSDSASVGDSFPLGPTTVTYTFTDDASPSNTETCTFTVTVSQPPSTGVTLVTPCPTGATGVTAVAGQSAAVTWTPPTAKDSNDNPIPASGITITDADGNAVAPDDDFPLGDTTVTYTFTDDASPSNTETCSFTVTVLPASTGVSVMDCPDNIVQTDLVVTWTAPTAKDSNDVPIAVGSIVSSPTSGSTFTLGDTVVTTTVTDTASNEDTTCTFTVTIYYFDRVDDNADPSQANPFLIKTSADLASLRSVVNANTTYTPVGGTASNYRAAAYRLVNDIDLGTGTGYTHIPIGTFRGTFDGNMKTLRNLTYRSSRAALGLFSVISGATILDLTLMDPAITNTTKNAGHTTGALVGDSINSLISNVSVTGGTIQGLQYTGGLVGSQTNGTITASSSSGAVSGASRIGGLLGYSTNGTITASYATGAVSGGNVGVGGLLGYSTGTITASYATGAVSGKGGGGLVGYRFSGTTTSSYWDTGTTGQSSSKGGTGKTTAQLQVLRTSTNLYATWTTPPWTFMAGAYPALSP